MRRQSSAAGLTALPDVLRLWPIHMGYPAIRLLRTLAALAAFMVGTSAAFGQAPAPKAYYPLNGDVLDYSGHGYNGVNYGAVFISPGYASGVLAAQFNGSSTSYIQIPCSIGVTGTGFTIAFWVKTTNTAGTGQWYGGKGLVDGDLPGAENDFGTALSGTKFAVGVGNPDTTLVSRTVINDGNWHHVAGTWNMSSGAMSIYVNGVVDTNRATSATGPRTAPSSICIGRTPQDPNYFIGAIADVQLFDSVLTAPQIAALASLAPAAPFVATPVASPSNVVYAGTTLTFNVLAAGVPPPASYQWRTNGVPIPVTTNATLVLSNVVTAQSGSYDVRVGNSAGTNTSPVLAVTVNPASIPVFTMQPAPATEQAYVSGQGVFAATVDGTPPIALQWLHGGAILPGQTANNLTLSGLQMSDAGSYALAASNALGTNLSQSAALTVLPAPTNAVVVNVPTYHNDNMRSGANTNEVILTPANVNPQSFGKLFSQAVDGAAYAEPLYVSGLNLPGAGIHNVVFVATQHGSVYAFDADNNQGANASPLWHASFINPAGGVTPISPSDVSGCANIPFEECIASTPAIDLNAGTMFVEAMTREVGGGATNLVHRLHALNITTGAEQANSPVVISGSVPGTGVGGSGGMIAFSAKLEQCRSALLVQNGFVYFCYSSQCDIGNYHGWVFAYNEQSLQQAAIYNNTPNGSLGGMWHGGDGMAADASNNIFAMTGNGSFSTNFTSLTQYNLGSSFLKFSGNSGLVLTDYFTPYNQASLRGADLDIAAGGPMVLPDSVGSVAHPRLMLGTGKDGTMYVLDRDQLGHYNAVTDTNIVQELPNAVGLPWNYPVPAYFNNLIYYQGNGSGMQAFGISGGVVTTTPVSTSTVIFGSPGGTPSVSANGTNSAIVWALQTDAWASGGPTVLHAFNATNLTQELYNSNVSPQRDSPGATLKWTVPAIVNGKVYVGEEFGLSVYGNGLFLATPVISPNGAVFTNSLMVTLSDANPGALIYYTLDGSLPTVNSTRYTGPLVLTNSAGLQAIALQSGAVNSSVASATFVNNSAAGTGTGLIGLYFANQTQTFNGLPTVFRTDPTINFNWNSVSPSPSIPLTNYTVRWTGSVQPRFNETYTFNATTDDGMRVWVNGQEIINGWVTVTGPTNYSGSIALKAQQLYTVRIDYYQSVGGAVAELQWSSPSTPLAVVPQTQLYIYTNPPPSVSISSPANNSSYTASASVTIGADADALYNPISQVAFYANTNTLLGTVTHAPYTVTATGLSAGNYALTAIATDGSGLSKTSAAVNITVTTGSGQPYGLTTRGTVPAYLDMPPTSSGSLPPLLSQTGVFSDTPGMAPANGLVPYQPNVPLWSDGALKDRWLALPNNGGSITPDEQITFAPTGTWTFPAGTVFVKTFKLQTNDSDPNSILRLETRLLVRDINGQVYGVTYKWRPDNSDADLLTASQTQIVPILTAAGTRTQTWYYPSPADCLTCHTPSANYVLGLNARQLNASMAYPATGVVDNELRTLNRLGMLNPAIDEGAIAGYEQLSALTNLTASPQERARSYLDANCAQCHQPGGTGPTFDARYETPLASQNITNFPAKFSLGYDNACIIRDQDIWRSVLYARMNIVDAANPGGKIQMPPLARNLIDTNAVAVMAAWINSLPGMAALAPPAIVPNGGAFSPSVNVTLLSPATNAAVYYTLDGSLPSPGSFLYSAPFNLATNAVVTANAWEDGFNNSVAVNALFIVGPPVFTSANFAQDGTFQLGLSGVPGNNYVLQATTNLVDWVSLSTNSAPTNMLNLVDPNSANFTRRYYRVMQQ